MQEKDMVLDILGCAKASIGEYAKMIPGCVDPTLRQTFQKMRDGDEKFQYDLYNIATQKGYAQKAPSPSQEEVNQIKSALTSSIH